MSRQNSALLVVDVQDKLLRLVPGQERIVWNIVRLIEGARILNIPVAATEQYPKGLGPTTSEIAQKLEAIASKVAFSCGECPEIFRSLAAQGVHKILIAGIEAHVCVQQTALDLMADGFDVYLAADAIGARYDIDYKIALRRMDSAGATLTTTEAALFEWCEQAGTAEFKQISELVRQVPPANAADRAP